MFPNPCQPRRGLAANLYELGEGETTIQAILRHADIKTMRRHHIKKNVVTEESKQAVNRLAQVFKRLQKPVRHHSLLGFGVVDADIQRILRHANVDVTRESYTKVEPSVQKRAMAKLQKALLAKRKKRKHNARKRKSVHE